MKDQEIQKLKQIIEEKDAEIEKLRQASRIDYSTDIYNRRGFEEEAVKLLKEVSFSKGNSRARKHFFIDSLSLIFFDIDNFKKINDKYGHKAGDMVLKKVAQLIMELIRNVDIVGRWGGEEMVVALFGASEKDAFRKAEEIRLAIENIIKTEDGESVTMSAGVSEYGAGDTLESIINKADMAMYAAKHQRGKNNVVRYSEIEKNL